jgi:cold shock CspA family protein
MTGTIVFWLPKRGTGVIRGEDGDYFAHITEFASTCKCGHMHKCEIAVGMRVEFTPSTEPHDGPKFPPAFGIRIVKGKA